MKRLFQVKNPRTLISLGMMFLAVAGMARLFLHPGPHLSANGVDGMIGFLYGLSIGTLLLGIRMQRRQKASGDCL